MKKVLALGITAVLLLGTVAAPAHAEWRGGNGNWHGNGGGGWHGGGGNWHGNGGYHGGGGGWVGPTILGLGAAAVLGGVIASQYPPPVYYAPPPPVYYAAPPPVYYAAPAPPARPGYWASDGRYYYY